MKKSILLICFSLLVGFLCIMVPSKAPALPDLQVYVQGGTAGDKGPDLDTWFTDSSIFPLKIVVWQHNYDDPNVGEGIEDLYLLVTVPIGEFAPSITGGAGPLASYSGTFPNNHYPVNRPSEFEYYQYLITGEVVFESIEAYDYNADEAITGPEDVMGAIYELSVEVSSSYAHFDAFATGHIYRNANQGLRDVALANPGSHDSSYSPVPEPATMLLFGTGLIGMAAIGRRKFRKK